jgi:hypothetical protein
MAVTDDEDYGAVPVRGDVPGGSPAAAGPAASH